MYSLTNVNLLLTKTHNNWTRICFHSQMLKTNWIRHITTGLSMSPTINVNPILIKSNNWSQPCFLSSILIPYWLKYIITELWHVFNQYVNDTLTKTQNNTKGNVLTHYNIYHVRITKTIIFDCNSYYSLHNRSNVWWLN